MCGIYGALASAEAIPDEAGALAAMDRALVHRGPDDTGTVLDGPCALGMRRLSIIDLQGGRQPIASEDKRVWVVGNGEIYNHRELRRDLAARGHRFATGSDIEVIAHLYEEEGAGCAERLRGMFAFAVWDRHARTLLLGRDRLGIKPLYYADTPRGLVFASELKALAVHPWVARRIDPVALDHYLSFGTSPPDRAFLDGVRKLPPGHVLGARAGCGVQFVRRYWDLRPPAAAEAPRTIGEATARVRALLEDAVESHLLSDVPVGAFLSGGVDSSAVVALMARSGAAPRTFSIGFAESDFDELAWARRVARRFGTRHEELVLRPDVWALTSELAHFLDEPFADVSAVPTYLVSKLAARRVKVVLSGDGGDEVFAGYDHYATGLRDARRYDRLPRAVRAALARLAAALPDDARGKNLLRHAALDPDRRFVDGESLLPPDRKSDLLHPDLARAVALADPIGDRARLLAEAPGRDLLARLQYLDVMTYLPLDILTKVDRMSMAWSLEVRPPLLDHLLVEEVARMPSRWKLDGNVRKILLKRAVADLLPPEILHREKRGFGVPIRHWFRGPLRDPARALLSDKRTRERGLLQPAAVERMWSEHLSGRRDQSLALWGLVVLELWQRAYLDGDAHESPAREAAA